MDEGTEAQSVAWTAFHILAVIGVIVGMIACAFLTGADMIHVGMGVLVALAVGGILGAMILPGRIPRRR
jgi:hypothetical protein